MRKYRWYAAAAIALLVAYAATFVYTVYWNFTVETAIVRRGSIAYHFLIPRILKGFPILAAAAPDVSYDSFVGDGPALPYCQVSYTSTAETTALIEASRNYLQKKGYRPGRLAVKPQSHIEQFDRGKHSVILKVFNRTEQVQDDAPNVYADYMNSDAVDWRYE